MFDQLRDLLGVEHVAVDRPVLANNRGQPVDVFSRLEWEVPIFFWIFFQCGTAATADPTATAPSGRAYVVHSEERAGQFHAGNPDTHGDLKRRRKPRRLGDGTGRQPPA